MPFPRRIVTPSNLLSVLAIVLACSGSAVAGATLVTGAQIRNETVSGADLRNGSVRRVDMEPAARVPNVVVREERELGAGPVTARCQAGERVTGGGGSAPNLTTTRPELDDSRQAVGWTVAGRLDEAAPVGGDGDPAVVADAVTVAYVLCARA